MLSEQDLVVINSALMRQLPDLVHVRFEPEDDHGRIYMFLDCGDKILRYVLGPLTRDTSGAIVPQTIALSAPGDIDN